MYLNLFLIFNTYNKVEIFNSICYYKTFWKVIVKYDELKYQVLVNLNKLNIIFYCKKI